jgi:short-subunit dehydrogenase involved in D-alanine esterification of teichoic acids
MRVLITGGTNGMGKGVATDLAKDKQNRHEIIILCRSKKLGFETIEDLRQLGHGHIYSLVVCDLMKLSDVFTAVNNLKKKYNYLDGVFINAGIGYAANRIVTEDKMMAHFQVNYLSQFMLTLRLLDLLEHSEVGGRVVFNVTRSGKINWDDLQMEEKWTYEEAIHQAMVAKRMFLSKLHRLYKNKDTNVSFIGFEINKTVWTNQLNIIPFFMKAFASVMKLLGTFMSIEECGKIISPLFIESGEKSIKKSGKLYTWNNRGFEELEESNAVLDTDSQNRLWDISLSLCADQDVWRISETLHISNNKL